MMICPVVQSQRKDGMASGLGQHQLKEILLSEMKKRWKDCTVIGWHVEGVCFGVWEVLGQIKVIVLLTNYEILQLEGAGRVCDEHKWLKCISMWEIF